MIDDYEWSECPLSSAEVDEATGLTSVIRRDWRRRGLLPKHGARTQLYSPREITELFVLLSYRQLTKGPLEHAVQQAKRAAPAVLYMLLDNFKFWYFHGSPAERDEFEKLDKTVKGEIAFTNQLKRLVGKPAEWHPSFYSAWDGDEWEEAAGPDDIFHLGKRRKLIPGKVVIDHESIARSMHKQIGRPLYTVKRKSAT